MTRFYESLWARLYWRIDYSIFRVKDRAIELLEPWIYKGDSRLCFDLAWRYAVTSNQLEDLDKLMDLASILESANDNEWDMGTWYRNDRCGTVGCAAYQYAKARPGSGFCIKDNEPVFRGRCGFDALQRYFGLSSTEADHIFDETYYPNRPVSRQQVIDRIRWFVASKRKESEAA